MDDLLDATVETVDGSRDDIVAARDAYEAVEQGNEALTAELEQALADGFTDTGQHSDGAR